MKQLTNINNFGSNDLLIPSFDHKEAEDDDCGLPENPIFSNYSKYLWQGHSENRRIRKNAGLPEHTDGHNRLK
jgi:hypothetical protein